MTKILAIIAIFIVVFGVLFAIPLTDIYKNKTLTTRAKWNCSFLVTMLPFYGAIIYYFYKWYVKANRAKKLLSV
jgi:hypothetical protein